MVDIFNKLTVLRVFHCDMNIYLAYDRATLKDIGFTTSG